MPILRWPFPQEDVFENSWWLERIEIVVKAISVFRKPIEHWNDELPEDQERDRFFRWLYED